MDIKKILLLSIISLAIGLFFYFDGSQYFSLAYFSEQKSQIIQYRDQHFALTVGLFFLIYITSTALSLPGATILTLAAGAIFGLLHGLVIVSFASTIGATLAFLASRYLLRDWVQERFSQQLRPINEGFEKEGNFYLFTLRLVPAFPFFAINLLMGITPIKTWNYYWVSQVGMLAGTIVYVNAGTQLGQIDTRGILSPALIISFCLLGIFPLLAKRITAWVQKKRLQTNAD